jgi:sugar O-acyltransferase (sialic acid O-acetyltransferase NeuD family)
MKPRLFIFGAGSHTKLIIDIFKSQGKNIHGVFDDFKNPKDIYYYNYKIMDKISNARKYLKRGDLLFCGIGDNKIRQQIANEFKDFMFPNCISSCSTISKSVKIGRGNFVGNYVVLEPDSVIGSHNIINDLALIGHDAKIGNFNIIAAHVCYGPYSSAKDNNLLGLNSTVNPTKLTIGNNNIIGSGTVVVKNVDNDSIIMGVPGKIKRE